MNAASARASTAAKAVQAPASAWVAHVFAALALTIGAWLVYSLIVVNIEFDDGYATIVNSQYFLGISGDYIWSRAPMMAWLMMPAEWAADALGLHPLDVRPHHALMVTIHFAYLLGVWSLLRARFGASPAVLIAFAAAIPTVVFFCYAPFISHDLLPGLILLAMLKLADLHALERSRWSWFALVVLGAAVALIKHMYGAIWVAILVAYACLAVRERSRESWWLVLRLAAAAACSGAIFWLAFAWVLGSSFPEAPLLLRPLQQMNAVVAAFQRAGPISEIIYQYVYLRNLSIYGFLAMSLILPGIFLSWRHGDRLQQTAAIVWIVLFTVMNLVSFKEARYLAYLSPLTALLIVPVIRSMLGWHRICTGVILAALLIDLGFGAREAWRITAPFYHDQVKEFLSPLPLADALAAPIVMTRMLSFVAPDKYAFFGDRYHRVINLNDDQIRLLYGYPRSMVRRFPEIRALAADAFKPGGMLIFVNDSAARVPPIARDNRTTLQPYFVQFIASAEQVILHRDGDHYRLGEPSPQPIMLLPAIDAGTEPITSFERFSIAEVTRSQRLATAPEQLPLLAFRIHALCNLGGCRRF